jgi:LysM repeat protein
MMHRRTLVTLLALLMLASSGLLIQPVRGQTNLLTNPGFEDPYTPFQGDTTRMVANGWSAWHVPQREGDEGFRNLKPEYQPASASNPDRILGGSNAQEYFSFFATHTGGVYQQVSVPTGSEVEFSVFAYVWSTSGTDVDVSEEPGRVQVQVGVDLNGGTDGESERIVWSLPLEFYDDYQQVSVRVPDATSRITVFVRTMFDLPQKNNNVYLDNASLTVVGTVPPTSTATARPSSTPRPSATALPSATPISVVTSTPLPSATPPGAPTNTLLPGLATPTQEQDATDEPFATATPTLAPTSVDFPYQFVYVVVAGDTVGGIALRFNSSTPAIIAANGLNSDGLIFVDQELIIPVREQPTPTITPTYSPTELGIIPTNTPVGMAPTPVPAPTTAPVGNTVTYTVQRGDTLNRIATTYGTTAAAIAQRNGILNPNLILVGQQLVIPVVGQPQPAPTPTPQPQPQPGATTHVVQPGENLYRISLRYGIPVNTLARINGIFNVNRIYVGQVIRLR